MVSQSNIDKCHLLCRIYKVNYKFPNNDLARAISAKNYIEVGTKLDNDMFVSAVFHEIQHCLNFRKGKYKTYHKLRKSKREVNRWMLPAEIYTDKMAKKLAESHGFTKYIITYKNDKLNRKFIKEHINKYFK